MAVHSSRGHGISLRFLCAVMVCLLFCGYFGSLFLLQSSTKRDVEEDVKKLLLRTVSPMEASGQQHQQQQQQQHQQQQAPRYLLARAILKQQQEFQYQQPHATSGAFPSLSQLNLTENYLFSAEGKINIWDLVPPRAVCPDLLRIGHMGDGGKWVCGLSSLASSAACVVYSFGISSDSSFEHALIDASSKAAKGACEVHAFDPTVGGLPVEKDTNGTKHVRFHKVALGVRSGGAPSLFEQQKEQQKHSHLVTESLMGIMHRLNHSFVDILKVDIEGGEWKLFDALFDHYASIRKPLPVGQILVELHYKTMPLMQAFFEKASAAGFVSVSREINLQPCLAGRKPVAAEYSFVNPSTYFLSQRERAKLFAVPSPSPPPPPPSPPSSSSSSLSSSPSTKAQTFLQKRRHQEAKGAEDLAYYEKVDAVIYFLTQHKRVDLMKFALGKLYMNFWRDFPSYPVLIFHDDLTLEDQHVLQSEMDRLAAQTAKERRISSSSTNIRSLPFSLKLRFASFTFEMPPVVLKVPIPEYTVCAPKSSSIGYRHMCRFHATVVHTLLDKEAKAMGIKNGFEYIWRLDDDSEITLSIGYDVFRLMKSNKKLYGFVNILEDDNKCVQGLWEATSRFLLQYPNQLATNNTDSSFYSLWPEPYAFYNNFEISHVSIWQSPLWKAYMRFIDQEGGIYMTRWGDAPLHTLGVSLLVGKHQLHGFTDIGYKHAPFLDQKADGLPMPNIDPFLSKEAMLCTYYDRWVCNSTSHVPFVLDSSTPATAAALLDVSSSSSSSASSSPYFSTIQYNGVLAPSWGEKIEPKINSMATTTTLATKAAITTTSLLSDFAGVRTVSMYVKRKGVLYTFAHAGKENELVATIINFFLNFAREFAIPFVIFFPQESALDVELIKTKLIAYDDRIAMLVSFAPVEDEQMRSSHSGNSKANGGNWRCIDSFNEEIRGASHYLRFNALNALANMGHDWFFRFGDDSKLLQKISFNIFDALHEQGKMYAFAAGHREVQECASGLWQLAKKLCSQQLFSCGDMFTKWNEEAVVLTNFEVSHKSVWTSPQCLALFQAVAEADVKESAKWGDSTIHTLCVLMSLQQAQVKRLDEDVVYETSAFFTTLIIEKGRVGVISNGSAIAAASSKLAATTAAIQLEPQAMPQVDAFFAPRRFGWMGGDVAASFVLPTSSMLLRLQTKEESVVAAEDEEFLTCWLFGDSLIGTSSATRRIEALFVSSTVGVARIKSSRGGEEGGSGVMKSIHYYWGSSSQGAPAPLFLPNLDTDAYSSSTTSSAVYKAHAETIYAQEPSFWPTGGISLVLTDEQPQAKLLIVGALVLQGKELKSSFAEDSPGLEFIEIGSALVVVENPLEAPDAWRIHNSILPSTILGARVTWVSITSKVRSIAHGDDWIYLLATFQPLVPVSTPLFDSYHVLNREKHQVVFRANGVALALHQLDALELLTNAGGSGDNAWQKVSSLTSSSKQQPMFLFAPSTSEASIHFDFALQKWKVLSLKVVDRNVQQCLSRNEDITSGPFTCSFVFAIPAPWNNKKFNSYAAKAHPELSLGETYYSSNSNTSLKVTSTVLSFVANPKYGPKHLFVENEHLYQAYAPKFFSLRQRT